MSEPSDIVYRFAADIEAGIVGPDITTTALQDRLEVSQLRLRAYRNVLAIPSEPRVLAASLRAAVATVVATTTKRDRVELAWTYPGRANPGFRTTAGAAREIIEGSRRSLLMVGYSISAAQRNANSPSGEILRCIADAALRGVSVTLVVHRTVNARVILNHWDSGLALPVVFTWPKRGDEMAALHAKVLVADRHDALVSSANLTYHGYHANIEMGVRVVGTTAGKIHDRFAELIAAGNLVPWKHAQS